MERCLSYRYRFMRGSNSKINLFKLLKLFVGLGLFFCCNLMTFANNNIFNKDEFVSRLKSMKMASSCTTFTSIDELETVKFGKYQQFKDEYGIYNKEPVEWILLYRDDNNAYLMSKYVLDSAQYNNEKPRFERGAYIYDSNIYDLASDWEHSTLRKWMSGTMYDELFNDEEKSLINTTYLDNTYVKDYEHYTVGGNHTEDKLYILNEEELFHFLGKGGIDEDESKLKAAKGTDYAIKQKNLNVDYHNDWYKGYSDYWIRNVKITESDLAVIRANGKYNHKVNIYDKRYGIRPCITIKLKESYDMARIDLSKDVRDVSADYKVIEDKKEAELSKYDTVKLGRWLDDKNNVELIWYVIAKENGMKLLLSKDVVTKEKYNKKKVDEVHWKDSNARIYLNDEFYNLVFNDEEKKKIQSVNLKTSDNSTSLKSEEYTLDKVFLLSYDEVMKYIGMDNINLLEAKPFDKTRVSSWALRTPGSKENRISIVSSSGKIDLKGNPSNNQQGIRPAMWIKEN